MIPRRLLIGVMGAGLLWPTIGRRLVHQISVEVGAAPNQHDAIIANSEQLFHDQSDPIQGNPMGSLAVVEFYDPRCPYCNAMRPVMRQLIRTDGRIRLIQKTLAMLGPDSVLEAKMIIAAGLQGRGIAMRSWIMDQRRPPSATEMLAAADSRRLNITQLKTDLESEAVRHSLAANRRLATALSIEGTPTFIVGRTLVPGAVDLATMRSLIDART